MSRPIYPLDRAIGHDVLRLMPDGSAYRPACPFDRVRGGDLLLVSPADVESLRMAARHKKGQQQSSGYSDDLLFHVANSELCSTVSLAWCCDPQDRDLFNQQERFKKAFRAFQNVIAVINSVNLRHSLQLPESYINSIDSNWLLDYAQQPEGGRQIEWRRDAFFVRILTLYQMFSGERPSGTVNGPALRFMRKTVDILIRFLATVLDRTTERYKLVDSLWRIPRSGTFLKEWFKAKAATIDIQRQLDAFVEMNVRDYEREVANRRDPETLPTGRLGLEKRAPDWG